ncbi:MAG TPA: protein kinase [Terrimesophilobacter sp.]|nr:protein kinase [Terrimesophilobacter sp.]HRP99063.1 protein kinase [Terrimesophilobacter sp.]
MQTIAGYRLIRVLARGAHSEVWLGAADAGASPVAIKLFHPSTALTRVDTEVEALGRASHRHVQRLLDISVDPGGRTCLVLERLGPSLARVLADRDRVSAGEAVTVLAPVCEALTELHRVGIAHGRLDAGSVLFDSSGAPVVSCLGGAVLVGDFPHPPQQASLTPAQQATDHDLAGDRVSLATLAEHVLARVGGENSVLRWLATCPSTSVGFAAELAERLHSSSPAAPIAIPRSGSGSSLSDARELSLALRSQQTHGAATDGYGDGDPSAVSSREPASVTTSSWLSGTAIASLMPPWLAAQFTRWFERLRTQWFEENDVGNAFDTARGIIGRVRKTVRTVRPRVWVLAVGGLVAVIFAVALVGTDATPPAEAQAPPGPVGAESPTETSIPAPVETGLEVSDEPVDIARTLLVLRERCYRELSVLCLDAADQPGSAAMEADRHAIRQHQQGAPHDGRLDWSQAELTLIDELGDGVLITASLSPPAVDAEQPTTATLLLVRTDEGWRIRDLIE